MRTDAGTLASWIVDARERTRALLVELPEARLVVPRMAIVNPVLWETGHVAWFQERWIVRERGRRASGLPRADEMLDSARVAHDTRWDLPLPDRAATLGYLERVRDASLLDLQRGEAELDLHELTVFHEDMHDEALLMTRQTVGDPAPSFACGAPESRDVGARDAGPHDAGPLDGDARVPGGRYVLGADPLHGFAFDNERDAHEVELDAFTIARAPVTQSQFAAFVDDGGYSRPALWSDDGWRWREREGAEAPRHWRRADGAWERRVFGAWRALEPHRPVLHVNWHEANAFCAWAGRRLPTEAEWETAASWDPIARRKRRFPWGDAAPTPDRALLDGRTTRCADVAAFPAGDSAFGCRQMIGNAWEWTASTFEPYPGFRPGDYAEYSAPWFSTQRVLRGGSFVTRSRLIRSTWRNFYEPWRQDAFAGFRTCAVG